MVNKHFEWGSSLVDPSLYITQTNEWHIIDFLVTL